MPKKSTRHVRETGLTRSSHHRSNPGTGPGSGSAAVAIAGTGTNLKAKHFRSVRIGLTNGKRWLSLKKRLGLSTDEDVAVYLLDLAESTSRHGDKYNGREEGKVERDKRDKTETIQAENPIEYAGEPLRRSLRKQSGGISPDPKVPSVDTTRTDSRSDVLNDVELHTRRSSKPKHHKNKAKHHKDKRKKRKRLRVVNAVSSTTESIDHDSVDIASSDERKISMERTDSGLASEVDTKSNLDDDKFGVTTKELDSITTKTEDLDNIKFVESVHTNKEEIIASCHDAKDINSSSVDKLSIKYNKSLQSRLDNSQTSLSRENIIDDIVNENLPLTINDQVSVDDSQDQSTQLRHNEHTALSERCVGSTLYSDRILNISKVNVDPTKEVEDRKVKKKRKRPRYTVEEDEEEENAVGDSSEEFFEETVQKHKRKKHKHNSEHKNRKHHDVRKAPQDGIVVREDIRETRSITNDPTGIPEERLQPQGEIGLENLMSEPQRLAIKIKLCQDCNSRHLQDACPLTTPQYTITDSISYENWLNKHSENLEVINAIRSDDPMSEGYGKVQEDNYESDEESLPTEHCKTKTKAHYEEKQLIVDVNRPLYARDSLPECFELKITNSEHGLGIYAKDSVPMYVKLGPLVGKPVREMDIPDDFSMRHIWEVDENNGKTSYISTTNPLKSNWIRYIRPAETKEERSVAVITRQGELHLVTTQNIVSGMELTYWQDSQSSAWTRKNKVDKTNCGGCNLNFAHPIYYRLHCCIFHDTNYSLTIRKYHCKVCGAAVLGKDNIMKHAAELHAGRGAYQCQYCKKFFLRLNYLEMHRTYGCAQNPQRSRPLCDYCGRKFCQPQKLKVHIKRMHSDMSEVLREFQCKLCLKLLGSRAALQRHMKEVHHKDVVGAATCDRCGKMFQNKSNLKIHMLTHSGVKPFKCKENGCKAAFTTKQCLQFHYKKVHGLTEDMMPKIERSVAYTFDAYSGGLVEDVGRGKTPRPSRRSSQQDNSNSLPSLDDCSSESSLKVETPNNSVHPTIIEFQGGPTSSAKYKTEHDSHISTQSLSVGGSVSNTFESTMVENVRAEVDLYSASRLQSKGSKKWLGEFNPPTTSDVTANTISHLTTNSVTNNVYEFEESRKENDEKTSSSNTARTQNMLESNKLGLSVYRRTESANASLLVEAALDAAERDIGAVSSPILEDNDRDTNLYSISSQLQSPIPQRSPTHLDSYIQQQEELISPAPTPDGRHSPPTHLHVDYQLHRPVDYISTPRTHNIDQYLHHEEMPRVSSPNNYIHIQQDDLVSPSVTPNPRYQDSAMHHHHQVPTDNLSSDEGDSVAQNLSLSVKEKALQLDLSTSYKYDPLEQDFVRERSNFEPLVLNTGELQGLDMSARGFHHGFGVQVQTPRYHHHHHHLYEITERQTVDLSRTGGYSISPPLTSAAAQAPPSSTAAQPTVGSSLPPLTSSVTAVSAPSVSTVPPPPYPHSDVLRVVSLDLTPGGRHTVDLTLSRAHHLHGSGARVITSPQSASSANLHIVPDTVEGRILSPPPPPPPLSGYNPSYPVSPAPYHPPRPGYHHYSGYY